MIHARGLSRRFGDLLAVDQLDLSVAPGEVLGFLGPNGAGKTTTMRMLCALIAPSEGTAIVAGHDVRSAPDAVRRSVGILTESPGLYDRLSARRNLEIFAALYDVDNIAHQVQRYLELVGLWQRRDDPVGSFSKGMRQKLALCRALLHEPPLIFLDEPTSALDPEAARMVREVIIQLKSEGRTIFLCTHNLDEADRLCDRVAIFHGRLLALNSPHQLRDAMYGSELVVQLANADDRFLAVLNALALPLQVVRQGQKLVLRLDQPEALTPRVVRALVQAGAEVLRVEPVQHSLEQIYLELIGGAP